MMKSAILGLAIAGLLAYAVVSCDGTNANNGGTGGYTSGAGGSSSAGSHSTGGATPNPECMHPDAGTVTDEDGGLVRIGATNPDKSVTLDVGGYYKMPSTSYQGYCFAFADDFSPGGSTIFPPCGTTGPCFTVDTGLCAVANIGIANGSHVYGAAIGCNLKQVQNTTFANYADVSGKTSVTVAVYGCQVPDQLQVQLNVANPPMTDAGLYGDGYFCNIATLSAPDSNGIRSVTIPIGSFREDCWNPGGPLLDPSSMLVTSLQAQISAVATQTVWDFCISKLSID